MFNFLSYETTFSMKSACQGDNSASNEFVHAVKDVNTKFKEHQTHLLTLEDFNSDDFLLEYFTDCCIRVSQLYITIALEGVVLTITITDLPL